MQLRFLACRRIRYRLGAKEESLKIKEKKSIILQSPFVIQANGKNDGMIRTQQQYLEEGLVKL